EFMSSTTCENNNSFSYWRWAVSRNRVSKRAGSNKFSRVTRVITHKGASARNGSNTAGIMIVPQRVPSLTIFEVLVYDAADTLEALPQRVSGVPRIGLAAHSRPSGRLIPLLQLMAELVESEQT